jgi:hypothetical protein
MRALDELERRFAEAIEAEQAARERARAPRRRRPWFPLATGGALAALAAVVVAVLVVVAGGGEERALTGAALLEQVAQAAEQAPAPPVLRGEEAWYVRGTTTEEWDVAGDSRPTGGHVTLTVRRSLSVETWSGLGTVARRRGLVLRSTSRPADRQRRPPDAWQTVGTLPSDADKGLTRVRGLPLDIGVLTPQELRDLPSEPGALLATIEEAVRTRSDVARSAPKFGPALLVRGQFDVIRGLLLLPVTPEQRAGLLRAFARLPGARPPGMGSDALGRRGLVLSFVWRGHTTQLVVSPVDGRLLATRVPGESPETTYVEQGVAPSVRALPPGVAPPKQQLPRTDWSEPARGLPGIQP